MKTSDAEIVKAFTICANQGACKDCPLDDLGGVERCIPTLLLNALDLINRLKAENESLVNIPPKDPMDFCGVVCNYAEELIEKAKSEAYKEFADKLKENAHTIDDDYSPNGEITYVEVEDIDNLLKEMG